MLNEDHQMDDKNYLLGLFVLILSSVDIFLNFSWYDVFFKRNERYTAFAMLIAMVIINIVITILIGLTDACVGDYLTNRKYISIGLYLIYDVWLCIATLIMLINNRKVDVS
jgi:tryptophan-rich sensory protein